MEGCTVWMHLVDLFTATCSYALALWIGSIRLLCCSLVRSLLRLAFSSGHWARALLTVALGALNTSLDG